MNIIGIYKITNTENGMVYVGQSRNVKKKDGLNINEVCVKVRMRTINYKRLIISMVTKYLFMKL